MFTRVTYIIMAFISLCISTGAHAANKACDVSVQEDIYWAAMDETVTLHFSYTIKGDGESEPTSKVHMEFSDKSKILLDENGRYIADAEDYGCEAQISTVKRQLIGNLSGKYKSLYAGTPVATMREVATLLEDDAFCAQDINPYVTQWLAKEHKGESNLSKIRQSNIWHSQHLTCNPILETVVFLDGAPGGMTIDTFNRLLAQDAPLIDVPYAYGATTYAFDRETRKLIPFSESGC